MLLVGCNSGDSSSKANPPSLTSIQISPEQVVVKGVSDLTIHKGTIQRFKATGFYSDGTSGDIGWDVDWHSDAQETAYIVGAGYIHGASVGKANITASMNGVTSNAVEIAISEAAITDIQIMPLLVQLPKGSTEQLYAVAKYGDDTSQDITSSVSWDSFDSNIAVVSKSGLLSGVNPGDTNVVATMDGIQTNPTPIQVISASPTGIKITPSSATVANGQTLRLKVIATFSDNSTRDISQAVTWVSADETIVTSTPNLLLKGLKPGNTTVTARWGKMTSSPTKVTVSAAVLTRIKLSPDFIGKLVKGNTEQLTAIGTYSDGSTFDITSSVTWRTSDANIAWVDHDGVAHSSMPGSTQVTATLYGITSINSVYVNVTRAIMTDLKIIPSSLSLEAGRSHAIALKTVATYSDGAKGFVDWVNYKSSDTDIVSIFHIGDVLYLDAHKSGTATITATSATDQVTSEPIVVTVTAENN